MECKNCGTKLAIGEKFCPSCGAKAENTELKLFVFIKEQWFKIAVIIVLICIGQILYNINDNLAGISSNLHKISDYIKYQAR